MKYLISLFSRKNENTYSGALAKMISILVIWSCLGQTELLVLHYTQFKLQIH